MADEKNLSADEKNPSARFGESFGELRLRRFAILPPQKPRALEGQWRAIVLSQKIGHIAVHGDTTGFAQPSFRKAAGKKADADYKAAKKACKPMKGAEHKTCLKEAKAKHEQEEKDIKAASKK